MGSVMTGKSHQELLDLYLTSDEFVGQVIHDVRGPLTGIISASRLISTLLHDEELDREQIDQVNDLIRQATEDMRVILEAAARADQARRHLE